MDLDPPEGTRADYYRQRARVVRDDAAKATTTEARDTLKSVADAYERLANYRESLWASVTPGESASPAHAKEENG
jgi:hypothetical protein